MNDYQKLALVTKSDQFYGYMIPLRDVLDKIGSAIVALNALDAIKKTLFYGRPYPIPMGEIADNASNISKNWVTIKDDLATNDRTITSYSDLTGEDVIHSILGMATEAGELLELLLKTVKTKNFDPVNFGEEIGDVFWYQAIGCEAVNTTFDAEQMRNIAKLKKRFGDKFSEFYANNRNLYAERKTLEATPTKDWAFITQKQIESAVNCLSIDSTLNKADFKIAEEIMREAQKFNADGTHKTGHEPLTASMMTGTQLDQSKAVPLDDRTRLEALERFYKAALKVDPDSIEKHTLVDLSKAVKEYENAKTALKL